MAARHGGHVPSPPATAVNSDARRPGPGAPAAGSRRGADGHTGAAVTISPPGPPNRPISSDLGGRDPPTAGRRRIRPARIRRSWPPASFILGMWVFVYIWGAVAEAGRQAGQPRLRPTGRAHLRGDRRPAGRAAAGPESKTNVGPGRGGGPDQRDLRAMLARLATVAPTSGNDGRIVVREWLADYGPTSGNREDYARRLRTDPGARFYESPERAGRADQHRHRHLGHGQPHAVLRDPRRPVLSGCRRAGIIDSARVGTALALTAMAVDVRTIEPDELARWVDAMRTGFLDAAGADPTEAEWRPPTSTSTTPGPPSTATASSAPCAASTRPSPSPAGRVGVGRRAHPRHRGGHPPPPGPADPR